MKRQSNSQIEAIDKAIDECTTHLAGFDPETKEHAKTMKQLKELYGLKEALSKRKPWPISPDTMLIVGANILGILLILHYEDRNVVTSKALGFVNKTKP